MNFRDHKLLEDIYMQSGYIVIFDVTSTISVEKLRYFLKINSSLLKDHPDRREHAKRVFIVGNIIDTEVRNFSYQQAQELCGEYGCRYSEINLNTGFNVDTMLEEVA